MSVQLVALLVFLAFVCGVAFLLLVIQWILHGRSQRQRSIVLPQRLRRSARRTPRVTGPIGRFDRWLSNLMTDADTGWDPASAALLVILCGLVAAGAVFLLQENLATTWLALLAGMAIPLLYFAVRKQRRIKLLQDQLPGALDMLARSVRAGKSLDQSLGVVGQQAAEPIATVFRIGAKQLEMGMSMPAVMESMVHRVHLSDMKIFTTTLTVHRQTGGNVAKVLERLACVIRDRLSYRRQLRVSTGASKASALLVASIGPLVFAFFVIFRPDYVQTMLSSQLGQMVLLLAVFLEVVGLVLTARLLKPTY